ncbi:MAG: hypothetical protein L3J79_11740, partial [Candidatus Marinimicrobia bacterium]|nr:hypothetical protein [Candidatus Neomarinimicrobiota bacterium]
EFEVYENKVYLATPESGILIYKLGVIGASQYAVIPYEGSISHVMLDDNNLIITDPDYGLIYYEINSISDWVTYSSCPIAELGLDIQRDGDFLYIGDGMQGLTVVDIEDINNPQMISNIPVTEWVRSICIQDNIAFLSCELGGLATVDISDPSDPEVLTIMDIEGEAFEFVTQGSYGFLAAGGGGIQIIEISDPANMEVVYQIGNGLSFAIDIHDSILVASSDLGELAIINVSNPLVPQILSTIYPMGEVNDIEIYRNTVYVLMDMGLQILDIESPTQPLELGFLEMFIDPMMGNADYQNDKVYIASPTEEGIQIVDVSDPTNPFIDGFINSMEPVGILVDGPYLFATRWQSLNIYHQELYSQIAMFPMSYPISNIQVHEGYAFLAAEAAGLMVVDVLPPNDLDIVEIAPGGPSEIISISENLLISLDNHNTLSLYGIDIPQLVLLDTISVELETGVSGIVLQGQTIGLNSMTGWLSLLSVGDGYNLEMMATIPIQGEQFYPLLHLDNDRAYVGVMDSLLAFDISDLLSPIALEPIATTGHPILMDDNILVCTNMAGDISLYSVVSGNSIEPLFEGLSLGFEPISSHMEDHLLYFVGDPSFDEDGQSPLIMIDINDPEDPQIAGGLLRRTIFTGIDSHADQVFVSTLTEGFLIYDNERYIPVSIDPAPGLITQYTLDQNYPNPFNPVTTIGFTLPERVQVSLIVYDIKGREVKHLVNRVKAAGYYESSWDGLDTG